MSKRSASAIAIAIATCALAVLIVFARSGSAGREKDETSSAEEQSASTPGVAPRLSDAPSSLSVEAAPPPAPAAIEPSAAPPAAAAPTEAELMEELRHARTYALAIRLAREGNQQFPDSEFAPERESILIHSLAENGQRSEARGEAEYMVNHYPDSKWAREIERFTGAHAHRNVRVNDAGQLEYTD